MPEGFPQATTPDADIRRLTSSLTGYGYDIHIALPATYGDTGKKYPTLYGLDPHLTFRTTREAMKMLESQAELPELIFVGIGSSEPDKDMESYQARDYLPKAAGTGAGGAGMFLRFLREDLIPFIGAEYRVDPKDRGFLGYSLAGLFGLYALLHQPDTFLRYIICSPWIDPNDSQVLSFETEYATTHSDLAAQVFIGAGSQEPKFVADNIQKLQKTIENRHYPNLRLETHIFEGETHHSVLSNTISRGLKTVYGEEKQPKGG